LGAAARHVWRQSSGLGTATRLYQMKGSCGEDDKGRKKVPDRVIIAQTGQRDNLPDANPGQLDGSRGQVAASGRDGSRASAVFLLLSSMRVGAFVSLPLAAVQLERGMVKGWPSFRGRI
jgi:hypothetical protein